MQCLNLKITFSCPNRCPFCFSGVRFNTGHRAKYELVKRMHDGYVCGCRHLVLTGGEPTSHPDFLPLVREAALLGYKRLTVQSNGYRLACIRFAEEFLKTADNLVLSVAISLHGHDCVLHDAHARRKGSFEEVLGTLSNFKDRCEVLTNTVVSKLNISHLSQIYALAEEHGVSLAQFSIMHIDSSGAEKLQPLYSDSVAAIREICTSTGSVLARSEGVPFCLMKGAETTVSEAHWPARLDVSGRPDHYLVKLDQIVSQQRFKPAKCSNCLMDSICKGVWTEYEDEFVNLFSSPIPAT